jgi:hypothetical protein
MTSAAVQAAEPVMWCARLKAVMAPSGFDEPTVASRVAPAWNPRRRVMRVRESNAELGRTP